MSISPVILNKNIKLSANEQGIALIKKLNEIFVELPLPLVMNVIASYVAQSFVNQCDCNEAKTENMIKLYSKGLIEISKAIIKNEKVN